MSTEPQLHTTEVVRAGPESGSYVDWPAILAGAVAAAAISLVLLTFGSAIGFSLTGPFGRQGAPLVWVAIAMAIWVVWVQVSAFMVGGYLAGRLRRRVNDATEHEVDVRDGFHGLLVWATGVVISALLAFGGLGGLAQGVGQASGAAAGVAIAQIDGDADPFDAVIDTLLRSPQSPGEDTAATRVEAGRILATGIVGDGISGEDRAYLAQLVAARSGIDQSEAEARVDQVLTRAQTIQSELVAAAEQARRIGILIAFLTAASLVASAAGAWFAAGIGGNHRDRHALVPFFNIRRPSVTT